MNYNQLVSVIVPVYNAERYLRECLDSIHKQIYKNIEVTLVNDGSKDNSLEIIKEYCEKLKWNLVDQKNGGLSNARNSGYKLAKGKYILFLDADDIFDENLVYKLVELAEKNKADIAICNFDVLDSQTGKISKSWEDRSPYIKNKTISSASIDSSVFPLWIIGTQVWTKLLKKDFLDKNSIMHDEELFRAEDIDFIGKAFFMAKNIAVINDPLIHYRINIESSNSNTIDLYPTALLDSLKNLQTVLKNLNIYEPWSGSLFDFAMKHCEVTIDNMNQVIGNLSHQLKYYEELGIKGNSNQFIKAVKRKLNR